MSKHNIQKKWSRLISLVTVIVLLMISFMTMTSFYAWADDKGDKGGNHKGITLEVVEDIPADEIEDAEIPLAALPVSEKSNAVRHMGMMIVLLGAVCAYSAYFISYEKKMVSLREKAAEAEDRL